MIVKSFLAAPSMEYLAEDAPEGASQGKALDAAPCMATEN